MKKILLVYGSGGHNEQMKRLYADLKTSAENKHCHLDFLSICDDDVKHVLTDQAYYVPTVTNKFSYIAIALRLPLVLVQIVKTLFILDKSHKVDIVISTGPGIAIIIGLYFKILRKKIIHVETWSRFYSKSLTGRIMYYFADEFIVQNEELVALYPKAIYKGRL